jgi:hypothetical protein
VLDMVRRDNALDCELGVVRLFGAADLGTQGMLSGWSGPEDGHTWNDGVEATYLLAMRPPVGRTVLLVGGEPYVSRARPVQELTVFGNGYRIQMWRMTARVETTLVIPLEPEWWFQRGQRAIMRLSFYLPNSSRPKDIADGVDGRELGFCFRSLCLRAVPD